MRGAWGSWRSSFSSEVLRIPRLSSSPVGPRPWLPPILTVLAHLATVLFRMGNVKGAIKRYGEAIDLAPKEPETHYQLGMVYFRSNLHAFALKKFDDVLALDAKHGKAKLFSGLALARLGRTREALLRLSDAVEQVRGSGALMRKVVATIEGLKRAIESGASTADVEDPLPSTDAPAKSASGSSAAAEKTLEGIAAAALRQGGARRIYERALDAIRKGRRREARELLQQVAKEHERYNDAIVDLGFMSIEDGDLKTAEASFNQALDFNPADRRASHGLADVYFRTGRLVPFRQQLVRLDATPAGTSFSEMMERAARRWQELLDVSPGDDQARFRLAQALFFTHALDEAVELLEPLAGHEEARRLLGQILLRQYVVRRSEVLYHRARKALGEGAYRFQEELPSFYEAVNERVISEMARRLEEKRRRGRRSAPRIPCSPSSATKCERERPSPWIGPMRIAWGSNDVVGSSSTSATRPCGRPMSIAWRGRPWSWTAAPFLPCPRRTKGFRPRRAPSPRARAFPSPPCPNPSI